MPIMSFPSHFNILNVTVFNNFKNGKILNKKRCRKWWTWYFTEIKQRQRSQSPELKFSIFQDSFQLRDDEWEGRKRQSSTK